MTTVDIDRLRQALSEADFPADKDDLIQYASLAGADENTIDALRTMPPVSYASMSEVESSVPRAPDRDPADQAAQRRTHTHPGLSEQEKDLPGHPIADELGENRGS